MGRTIDTKAKIIVAFLELYSKKSIENIRVMDICKVVGISRGAFYYHFYDVRDVCEEIEDSIIAEAVNTEAIKSIPTMIKYFEMKDFDKFVDGILSVLLKHEKRKRTIQILMKGSRCKEFWEKWIRSVSSINGECFKHTKLSPEHQFWMGQFIASGYVNMLCKWINDGCKEDPRIIAETYANVLFRGSRILEK